MADQLKILLPFSVKPGSRALFCFCCRKGGSSAVFIERSFVRKIKFFSTGTQENQYLRPAFVSFHNGRKSKKVKKNIHFVALTSF